MFYVVFSLFYVGRLGGRPVAFPLAPTCPDGSADALQPFCLFYVVFCLFYGWHMRGRS